MKREIKFRAWIPELGHMLEDVTLGHGTIGFPSDDEDFDNALKTKGFNINEDEDNLPEWIYDTGEDWYMITDPKDFELMQLTGLHDKNGVEIYEGDIVEAVFNHQGKPTDIKFKAKIVYNNYVGGFQIAYKSMGGGFVTDFPYHKYFLEVIGNIFENPDLLK